jgi:DNA repair photolyase
MKKGNMYDFVDIKWNPLAGECFHKCGYCSTESFLRYPGCKSKYSGVPRIDEKQINKNLGKGNFVFVVAQNDLFAQNVNQNIVEEVLMSCKKYDNTYLFQTKNPLRLSQMIERFYFPVKSIFCFTVETNRCYPEHMGNCSEPEKRLFEILTHFQSNCQITIEPIMDFDLDVLVPFLIKINPSQVNIGADSKNHNLPEPSKERVLSLIYELEKFTKVVKKSNLNRLIK